MCKVCFPWFTDHGIDGEAKAYMQLTKEVMEDGERKKTRDYTAEAR